MVFHFRKMQKYVGNFVGEGKPEVVDPVVPGGVHNCRIVLVPETGPIKISFGKMGENEELEAGIF